MLQPGGTKQVTQVNTRELVGVQSFKELIIVSNWINLAVQPTNSKLAG